MSSQVSSRRSSASSLAPILQHQSEEEDQYKEQRKLLASAHQFIHNSPSAAAPATTADNAGENAFDPAKKATFMDADHALNSPPKRRFTLPHNNFLNHLERKGVQWIHSHAKIFTDNYIFMPQSLFLHIWNSIIVIILLYNMVLIPITACYRPELYSQYMELVAFDYIVDCICLIDCIIQCRTAFYNEWEELITNPSLVWQHAMQKGIIFYIIGLIPLELFFLGSYSVGSPGFALLKLIRIVRFRRFLHAADRAVTSVYFTSRLIRLFSISLLVFHCCGAVFFELGQAEISAYDAPGPVIPSTVSWTASFHISDADIDTQWASSYYCFVEYFFTIGYGDLTPVTNIEKIIVIIILIIGVMVNSLLLSIITLILANVDKSTLRLEAGLHDLQQIALVFPHLPASLRAQHKRKYIENWRIYKGFDPNSVVAQLPKIHQTETKLFLHAELVSKLPWFQRCGDDFITAIVRQLRSQLILAQEVLFKQGEPADCMYFVATGTLKLIRFTEGGTVEFEKIVGPGDYFGELALIFNESRSATIVAISHAEVCCLNKLEFREILLQHKKAAQFVIREAKKRKAADKRRNQAQTKGNGSGFNKKINNLGKKNSKNNSQTNSRRNSKAPDGSTQQISREVGVNELKLDQNSSNLLPVAPHSLVDRSADDVAGSARGLHALDGLQSHQVVPISEHNTDSARGGENSNIISIINGKDNAEGTLRALPKRNRTEQRQRRFDRAVVLNLINDIMQRMDAVQDRLDEQANSGNAVNSPKSNNFDGSAAMSSAKSSGSTGRSEALQLAQELGLIQDEKPH
jgi:CRP-like cAMP-binding protein